VTLGGEATLRSLELEVGQEVVSLFEVRADGVDLVDEILNAGDSMLSKAIVDLAVVIKSDALLVDATKTSLVDDLTHSVDGRVTVGDVRLDETKHHQSGLVDLDEDTVVHLTKTQKLHDLLGLRWDLVATCKTDREDELWLRLDEVVAFAMSLTTQVDQIILFTEIFLLVLGEIRFGELAKALVLALDLSDGC